MRVRAVGAAIGVVAALWPAWAVGAAPPNPQTMRAALADPIDPEFVEADVGTQGTLEGPFDASQYADYWRGTGVSDAEANGMLHHLSQDQFVGGYGRQWYVPGGGQVMGELMLVFQTGKGALASEQASKLRYGEDSSFRSWIDPGLGGNNAFGSTVASYGYDWTEVIFVKGNALYAVSRASRTDYVTQGTLSQAQREYSVAPLSIPVEASKGVVSGAVQTLRLALIVVAMLALGAVAAVVMVVVLALPRKQSSAAGIETPRS